MQTKVFGIKLNLFYGQDDTFSASQESLYGERIYPKRIVQVQLYDHYILKNINFIKLRYLELHGNYIDSNSLIWNGVKVN